MSRSFFLVWGVQSVVVLYSVVISFVIAVDAFIKSANVVVMALIVFAQLAPRIYLGLFSGRFVDRTDIFAVLVRANWTQAVVSFSTSIVVLSTNHIPTVVVMFVLLRSVIDSFKELALQSSIKDLVVGTAYQRASGLVVAIQNFSVAVGPFLGVVAHYWVGSDNVWALFLIDGGICAVVAMVLTKGATKRQGRMERSACPSSLWAGFAYIWPNHELRSLMFFFRL